MPILRVTAEWTGFSGAPGYSNFHFIGDGGGYDLAGARSVVHGFFDAMSNSLPNSVEVSINQQGEILDTLTGELTGYLDDDTLLEPVSGGPNTTYSGATGAVVNWLTGSVRAGRRVRGRTFLVPLDALSFDATGTLTNTALENVRSGAELLVDSAPVTGFCVWARPANGMAGLAAPVTGARVPDLAAVLRSRRD